MASQAQLPGNCGELPNGEVKLQFSATEVMKKLCVWQQYWGARWPDEAQHALLPCNMQGEGST